MVVLMSGESVARIQPLKGLAQAWALPHHSQFYRFYLKGRVAVHQRSRCLWLEPLHIGVQEPGRGGGAPGCHRRPAGCGESSEAQPTY